MMTSNLFGVNLAKAALKANLTGGSGSIASSGFSGMPLSLETLPCRVIGVILTETAVWLHSACDLYLPSTKVTGICSAYLSQ